MPWRLLVRLDPADGPTNMALDAALLESVRAGGDSVLRFYRWSPPTLSFGRNQPARGLYDDAAAQERGIAFVRRPTGGQAVLHADELTYALVSPVAVAGRPREAYQRINAALVAGLRALGVQAAAHGAGAPVRDEEPRPRWRDGRDGPDWGAACFRRPAPGEVVVAGRKLVGSAQRCEGRVILQHGSVLVSGSQAAAEALLRQRTAAGSVAGDAPSRPAGRDWMTLEEALGERPAWAALTAALVAGFERVFGTALAPGQIAIEESTRARDLRAKFAAPDWTWRR